MARRIFVQRRLGFVREPAGELAERDIYRGADVLDFIGVWMHSSLTERLV